MKKKRNFIDIALVIRKRPQEREFKDRSIVDLSWGGVGRKADWKELQFNLSPVHLSISFTEQEAINLANKLLEITKRKPRW